MSGFERKMSGTERRFVPMPNANVVICARMKGAVSEDALKAAVLAVRHKHPLLGEWLLTHTTMRSISRIAV